MRVPDHVLDRVRGAVLVAALSACGSEATPPAAPPVAPPPPETVAAAPEPIDPVAYARDGESERFARIDQEEIASLDRRTTRIADLRRERNEEALGGIGGTGISGVPPWGNVCMACGRG